MTTECPAVPFFSIITICRNAQTLIGPTIDSLARQDWRDFEYLVIDGASTDGTLEVVRERALGLQLRLVSEPDNGIYDAMNKGARLANGQWVYYLNAGDDLIDASVLRRVAMQLSATPSIDIAYGDVIYRGEGGEHLVRFDWLTRSNLLFEHLCHQAVFAARATFERFGLFDTQYRINADFEWLLRVFRQGASTCYLGYPIAFYDDAGFSARHKAATRSERALIRRRYLPIGLAMPLEIGYRVYRKALRVVRRSKR